MHSYARMYNIYALSLDPYYRAVGLIHVQLYMFLSFDGHLKNEGTIEGILANRFARIFTE